LEGVPILIIHCLHGFLGLPSDWNGFPQFQAHDLYPTIAPYDLWTERQIAKFPLDHRKRILLGYSLGGRLALHLLIKYPEYWTGGIIISAHPGLSDPEEKKKRYSQDLEWAKRFQEEPWQPLIQAWNQQSVFTHSLPMGRLETDFKRNQLSRMLQTWSLGLQEDLSEPIANLNVPLLWMVGEKDPKFCQIHLTSNHPQSKIWIAPESGHRVPWDAPKTFYEQVMQFCEEICLIPSPKSGSL